MEEQLVTFETAKLAKEKGLDLEFCNVGWHGDFGDLEGDSYPFLGTYSFYKSIYCDNKKEYQIQRPTQSLLQRWLREVYNINVWVSSKTTDKGNTIFIPHGRTIPDTIKKGLVKDVIVYKTFDNNEEALEFGLQQALKLIK